MSLRIWLPLNGSLDNLGLDQVEVVNNGATINNSGKIGQCYYFNGSSCINLSGIDINNTWSYGCWFKEAASSRSWEGLMILNNTGGDSDIQFGFYMYPTGSRLQTTANGQYNSSVSHTFDNEWHHLFATFDGSTLRTYRDGSLINTKAITSSLLKRTYLTLGARRSGTSTNGNYWIGYMNDVRVYDHCLSSKEVEEISKGLILHYKLDKNFNQLNNCYSYPTFNTTSSNGGWSHWAPSGSSGTFGQNTDSEYIYDKNNTYSHWFSCASTSTGYYLFYQSPAFDGGYRSIQFIIKEENSLPIVESICYPSWNARNGGAVSNKWTSIIPLGDGFYLCKVEGVSQDGSNDLIGFSVKPGYKVYVSCGYCENNREICSDIFNQDDLSNITDSSGYSNNATASNITNINDSPKYGLSSIFNGTNSYVKVTNNSWNPQGMEQITLNIWAKAATWPNNGGRLLSCTETGGFNLEGGNSGYWRFPIHVYTNAGKTSTAYKYDSKEILISSLIPDEWNMITLVYDAAAGTKTYINGELHHTYSNVSYGIHFNMNARLFLGCEANAASAYTPYFNGQMSDFRIYATALTAEQIKELYDTSMGIDSNGNVYVREVVE